MNKTAWNLKHEHVNKNFIKSWSWNDKDTETDFNWNKQHQHASFVWWRFLLLVLLVMWWSRSVSLSQLKTQTNVIKTWSDQLGSFCVLVLVHIVFLFLFFIFPPAWITCAPFAPAPPAHLSQLTWVQFPSYILSIYTFHFPLCQI